MFVKSMLAFVGSVAALSNGFASATSIPVGNSDFNATSTGGYKVVLNGTSATAPANDYVTPAADTAMPSWGVVVQSPQTPGTPGYWSVGFQTLAQGNITAGATGTQMAFANGGMNLIYQDVGAVTANTTYTLTVGVGSPGSGYGSSASDKATIALANGTVGTGSGSYATLPTINAANESTFSTTLGTLTDNSVTLTTGATASGDLTIILENATAQFSTGTNVLESQVNFDNVRVNAAAVPEPTSIALLALAAGAMCLLGRRKSLPIS